MASNARHGRLGMIGFRLEMLEERRLMSAPVLDPNFGSAGMVTYDPGPASLNHAIAVQADGKVLLAGQQGSNAYLARLNANGTVDASFGTGGIVKLDLGDNESFTAIAVLDTGKILVAGQASKGIRRNSFLARYQSNGVLDVDTRFGHGDGIEMLGSGQYITAMTVAGSKLFTVDGNFVRRRNIGTGTADVGFGAAGAVDVATVTSLTSFSADDVAVSSGGKIAIAAHAVSSDLNETKVVQGSGPDAASGACVVVLTSAGALDNTFDSNGVRFVPGADSQRIAYAPDGLIFLATDQLEPAESPLPGLFKFSTNGTPTFAQSTTAAPTEAVAVLGSGKVVKAGDTTATRFTSTGAIDSTYTSTGTATANLVTFNGSAFGLTTEDGGAAIGSDGSAFAANSFDRGRENAKEYGPVVIGKFLAEPSAPG